MSVADELQSIITTAVASLNPKPAVQCGEPDVVTLPTISYWYLGTKVWESHTLTKAQEISEWRIRAQLPAGPRFAPSNGWYEAWLEAAVNAIRGGLLADVSLGGAATGHGGYIGDAKAGWAAVGDQWTRLADMDLPVYLSETHSIA